MPSVTLALPNLSAVPVLNSPILMTFANVAVGIFGVAEQSGLTQVLGQSQWGGWALMALAAINGVAHASALAAGALPKATA